MEWENYNNTTGLGMASIKVLEKVKRINLDRVIAIVMLVVGAFGLAVTTLRGNFLNVKSLPSTYTVIG